MPQFVRLYAVLLSATLIMWAAGLSADPADIRALISGVRAIGHQIPEADRMVASCDGDAMCAARFLKNSIGPGAEIIPAETGAPSRTAWGGRDMPIRVVPDDSIGGMKIEIRKFDEVFLSNIFNRLSIIPKKVVLDIRNVDLSEKLGEMRRTVGMFSGRQDRAFQMIYATGRQVDWQIPKPSTLWAGLDLHVRIDAETPGNGIAFAALLKRYANATISGPNLPETIPLHEIVPIMHGWDMLVPSAEVRILQ